MNAQTGVIIEIDEEALGLLVVMEEELVFHAVHPAVQRLHGQRFHDGVAARREAMKAFRSAA
ncbi:hypothetical protein CHU95_14795 [Niveispirillum lacus]|uniref:Uncharacterized protein n=1 Tax=Niveispirillum lacus TaxID=1981099 RepID=A0A255YWM5_9PROT|nr:hypothetical protein [Niveispirillum lacus]OYQ33637.1 hypothetical protein CHU95_14795 [Niveispirillum lacus]